MGFWKRQQEAIDELKCFAVDIEETGNSNEMIKYKEKWKNLYYHVKDNLKELGVKV